MKIIYQNTCGKVTKPDEATLTYDCAIDDKQQLHIRLNRNTTGGLFSQEWLA